MTELYRTSGAGNDFLALLEPMSAPEAATIRSWCRRGVSLGADGVFVLRRSGHGTLAMDYYNADGGWAALCVNATRCAAQLAFHLGWANGAVQVATGAGPFAARRRGDTEVELEAEPAGETPRPIRLAIDDGSSVEGWALTVGVPHAVIPWPEDLAHCPVSRLGPPVRHHAEFPAGANANFVRWAGPHELDIRTYERGVEAETLACGSGVLAAVATGVAIGTLRLPVRARTKGGFVLTVDGETTADGRRIERWTMTGDARVLARVEVLPTSAHAPPAPAWS